MTLDDLRAACTRINPLDGKLVAHIYMTVPRSTCPVGVNIRLLNKFGPFGKICNVKREGDGYICTAIFKTKKVLAYLDAHE